MDTRLHTLDAQNGAQLANDDLRRYRDDGVLCFRNLLSEELLLRVAGDLEQLISIREQDHGIDPGRRPATYAEQITWLSHRLVRLANDVPGSQSAIYDAMSHMPAMHAIAGCSRLHVPIRQLVSPQVMVHGRLILLMAMPKSEWHLPLWHQDWYYNEGPEDTLTVYIPLQLTDENNGSLLVAVGDHQRGLFPHGDYEHGFKTKWNTIDPNSVSTFSNVVNTSLNPGDALMFNSMLPHSARFNKTDSVRFVINLRFYNLQDTTFRSEDWRVKPITHARQALGRQQPAEKS